MAARLRVMHWNVFEDGLTDAPASLGFSLSFRGRLDALLAALSAGGGKPFRGFQPSRDLKILPAAVDISSTTAFFGHIDVAYTCLYHSLGGEARFGASAPGAPPNLGNSLRTLYLHTRLADPPPEAGTPSAPSRRWLAPCFEEEVRKATKGAPSAEAEAFAGRLGGLEQSVFDAGGGLLVWERAEVQDIWKRENNVWEDKWCKDLALFLAPPADITPAAAEALSHFCRVVPADSGAGDLAALIECAVGAGGELERVRTRTLHESILWLLTELCEHSLGGAASEGAVAAFAGVDEVPGTAEGRAMLIYPLVVARGNLLSNTTCLTQVFFKRDR